MHAWRLTIIALSVTLLMLPTPVANGAAAATGSIAVRLHACPAPMRPLDLDPAACPLAPDVADLRIFVLGGGGNQRDLTDATREGDTFTWTGLPFAEYLLQPSALAPGYDRYLIPGRRGLNLAPDLGYSVSPNEGYLLPLDAAHPAYDLDLYVFRAAESAGSLRLGARFWQCPPGVAAAPDMRDLGCVSLSAPPPGFELEIAGAGAQSPLRLTQATPEAGGFQSWGAVPGGEYRVTARLPAETPGYAVRSYDPGVRVQLLSDHSGYALVFLLGAGARPAPSNAALDVYVLS
jgi:hypothetical protein